MSLPPTRIVITHDPVVGYWLETKCGDTQIGPADGWVKVGRRWLPKGYATRAEAEASLAKRNPA